MRSLWTYRAFILASIRRDLHTRYAGSLLGAAWQVLSPLALITVYTVVFAQFLRARLPGISDPYAYAVFVCAGLLPWTMFTEIVGRSQGMFLEFANLLKKSSFPRICLPAIVIGAAVANFVIVYFVFYLLLAAFGRAPGLALVYLTIPIALLVAVAAGTGVLLGLTHVYFRDVGQALGIVLQVSFWLTPIAYPLAVLPREYQHWVAINPLTPLFQAVQGVFLEDSVVAADRLWLPAATAMMLIVFAGWAFRRKATLLADEL